jgi:hypothetical protein
LLKTAKTVLPNITAFSQDSFQRQPREILSLGLHLTLPIVELTRLTIRAATALNFLHLYTVENHALRIVIADLCGRTRLLVRKEGNENKRFLKWLMVMFPGVEQRT